VASGSSGKSVPSFDKTVASPARIWNFWVGGKDNYEADREAAARLLAFMPTLPAGVRLSRRFLLDAVRYLATVHGARQFLDIGAGLPAADNTHEVAQRAAPSSRVVYVDSDPVVISHAKARLTSAPEGDADFVHADLRDPGPLLERAGRTLDFTKPVAVIMVQVLHFIEDSEDPYGIVRRVMDATAPGSFLVIAQAPSDMDPDGRRELDELAKISRVPIRPRSRAEVARFFDGLDLLGPGVAGGLEWLERWSAADGVDRIGVIPDGVIFGPNGIGRKP
jgi:hypothetical protein